MRDHAVLWRRLDIPGHDSARLFAEGAQRHLHGTAVFAHEGQPCRLDYRVACDATWRTRSARVAGWVGLRRVGVDLSVDHEQRWRLNGADCPDVAGCVDVDLAFTPATNLLPIRRLALTVSDDARVRAAWLRFPELDLQPLDQRYARTDERRWRYESRGGTFTAEVDVDAHGFVTRYADIWAAG